MAFQSRIAQTWKEHRMKWPSMSAWQPLGPLRRHAALRRIDELGDHMEYEQSGVQGAEHGEAWRRIDPADDEVGTRVSAIAARAANGELEMDEAADVHTHVRALCKTYWTCSPALIWTFIQASSGVFSFARLFFFVRARQTSFFHG